ncbi:chemotaxis protein CheY [Pseudomonas sp. R11-23-07]|uniref:chemotaxis protein CheY n=1 Tax=Pseudomonas sp. R11-23-07 TaxID=658632 RepID=UPI000F57C588|nr:chemotaxis protein CheY [Pseudomonas sp. R11-23-07]AZF60128.1 hypothetical protein C4J84_4282 [Pseudomonas sp. R11-23-07]
MPDKELKILIADTSLPRLIQIEKCLNTLGYYRILALQSSEDLHVVNHSLIDYFDVLIANKALASNINPPFPRLARQSTDKVPPTLLYDRSHSPPTLELIEHFMAEIDPPSPFACLKHLPWAKGPRPDVTDQ